MGYSDLAFPDETQLLPSHQSALTYLKQYAEDVEDLIQVRPKVLTVEPEDGLKWRVPTQGVDSGDLKSQTYDAVVVANGHSDVPSIPKIEGIGNVEGQIPWQRLTFYLVPERIAFHGQESHLCWNGCIGQRSSHASRVCGQAAGHRLQTLPCP